MSNALTTLVPVLDGTNYREWFKAMQVYLMSMDLWEYANGDESEPIISATSTNDQRLAHKAWKSSNQRRTSFSGNHHQLDHFCNRSSVGTQFRRSNYLPPPSQNNINSLLSYTFKNFIIPVTGRSTMPVNATASQVEKRATSVAHSRTAQPSPSPLAREPNKVKTRSAADTLAQTKAPADLTEARKTLNAYHLLPENAPCTVQTLACVLHTLAQTYKMPENMSRVINHVAELMHYADQQRSRNESENALRDVVKDLQSNLSAKLDSKLLALEKKLNLPSPAQKQLESTAKELESAVESIKASTKDMGKSLAQITNTNSQLENTATSYKEVLLKSNEQQVQPRNLDSPSQTDPRILRDVERKSRQILVNTCDPKINDVSNNEIKEKVTNAIKAITKPTPPKDITILDVSKLWKGEFTVIFKDKEIINWLQDIKVEFDFVTGIAPDATITKRVFPILAPRIPLTFDPTNGDHLREIEECNNFPMGTVEKARWIKPANRRAPGQTAAHAILTIKDISLANTCIRDGISICGLRVWPTRLKHEPMQCVMTPPMVGSTWPRVCSTLESDCLPALSQGTASFRLVVD